MDINISTFIPLLHLIPEGGMSPLPVRKDSGGKVDLLWNCVFNAYNPEAFKVEAAIFPSATTHTVRHVALVLFVLYGIPNAHFGALNQSNVHKS